MKELDTKGISTVEDDCELNSAEVVVDSFSHCKMVISMKNAVFIDLFEIGCGHSNLNEK